jgi:hypothetical protein
MSFPRQCRRFLSAVALVLLIPAVAWACPFCDGGSSGRNEVNEAIFGDGFWFNLVAAGSPFVVALALALVIHGAPAGRKRVTTADGLATGVADGRPH